MVGTRRKSRKNTSRYNMHGCSKRHFFAKGGPEMHGKIRSKKCKCACHLNKDHKPECKCNCHQLNKAFGGRRSRGRSRGLRGGDALNLSLAYTGKQIPLSPSPYGAYVGKGGNKAYPIVNNTGGKTGWLNPSQTIRGGGHGSSTSYANGLVGSAWTGGNTDSWPGVNGVGGDGNHLGLNTYNNDVSRQMTDVGANYPFNGMLRGGSRRRGCGHGRGCKCGQGRNRKLRGGGLLPQNLVNVGRNFMYNIGASNNTMNGYDLPVKPLPFEDQLVSNNSKFFNL